MADQSASHVTEDMVTRASMVLWTEVDPVYQADPRDYTDADVAAGKLRDADDADVAANRAIVRHVLEAAFPRCPMTSAGC
jgi:uridylate kinase